VHAVRPSQLWYRANKLLRGPHDNDCSPVLRLLQCTACAAEEVKECMR
jgi:hypothetical protein